MLDLGAGTELLSAALLQSLPEAHLTVLDASPDMLDVARRRLGGRATFVAGDLKDPLPEGPFDAVVSALAIHHLSDTDKRRLFDRIRSQLRPGGAFVNAEQVLGPTDWHSELYAAPMHATPGS